MQWYWYISYGLICPPILIIDLMISKVGALSHGSKNNDDDEIQACCYCMYYWYVWTSDALPSS
jgi:hypothetical protein